MLRIHQCKSATAAQSYYTQGLAREDYYSQAQEVPGVWGGKAAELLGINVGVSATNVDRASFVALTENRHPTSGDRLTLRTKHDRTIGYDVSFHAPKGVSLLHAIHGDERIRDVFREAVQETMRLMEADAQVRVRKAGVQEDRMSGNLIWAEFVHLTARPTEDDAPDPHLHAHCFVFNASFDESEGAWKAGQFRGLVRDAPYYEAVFHGWLAEKLHHLGYPIERTDTGWDLAGLPRSLIEKFSRRTQVIEAFAAEHGIEDAAAKSALGARTRRSKDREARIDDLTEAWNDRLSAAERSILNAMAAKGAASVGIEPETDPDEREQRRAEKAREALEHAMKHCFERMSSMPERRLIAEALRNGVGAVTLTDVTEAMAQREWIVRNVRGQRLLTTREVLDEERTMLAFAVEGKGTQTPFAARLVAHRGSDWEVSDRRLAEDQRNAVKHLLESSDRVMAVRGPAGAGKTTMMQEAIKAIRASGRSVVVVAPTANAARGEDSLRSKGFPGADTVAKLMRDAQMQQGLENSSGGGVLWVDEAGLLGVGAIRQLFDLAERHDARVVLCGDSRQHKPVERGDALRVLERLGGVHSVELTSIRRQRGVYRDAVAALAHGDGERGVELLGKLGAFHEIQSGAERTRTAARDYVDTLESGRTALVVSPTHFEGERVAAAIRDEMRSRGRLHGPDREFSRLRDTGWTQAERQDTAKYKKGLVAHFHQHAKGVVAGDKCRILGTFRTDDGTTRVRARTPRGVEIDLSIDHGDRFQVYREDSMKVAIGDRVRITRNGRTADDRGRLTNGAVHTLVGYTKHGAMVLSAGKGRKRVVPKEYGHIAPGSVMTSYAAQGRDVDRAILVQSADSMAASSGEQFYVSVSRGKHEIVIYTDDAENMAKAVRRSAERLSGTELAAMPLVSLGAVAQRLQQRSARALARDVGRREAIKRRSAAKSKDGTPDASKARSGRSRRRGKDDPGRERSRDR